MKLVNRRKEKKREEERQREEEGKEADIQGVDGRSLQKDHRPPKEVCERLPPVLKG